jgi:molybdopterin synthase catalytic subunit
VNRPAAPFELTVVPALRLSRSPWTRSCSSAVALATFLGTTRSESRGRTVQHLDYEAYEGIAEQIMEDSPEMSAANRQRTMRIAAFRLKSLETCRAR